MDRDSGGESGHGARAGRDTQKNPRFHFATVVPVKICDFDLASGLKEVRELRNKMGSAGSSSLPFQSGGQSFENPIGHHDFQPFNQDVGGSYRYGCFAQLAQD